MFTTHKKRRKSSLCPNCEEILKGEENFCPKCGQENHDLKIPLGHLIYEFIESIFHFDIKVWETLRVAFTKPGLLTKNFNEGKRNRYVPPARLYVFISVIFFFLLNSVFDKSVENALESSLFGEKAVINADFPSLDFANDELINGTLRNWAHRGLIVQNVPQSPIATLRSRVTAMLLQSKDINQKSLDKESISYIDHLAQAGLKVILNDSVVVDKNEKGYKLKMLIPYETLKKDSLNGVKWLNSSSFIDKEIDKLQGLNNKSEKNLIKTAVKLQMSYRYETTTQFKSRIKVLSKKILKYASVAMFFLMPLMALFLKLLYFRKTYYYENFIFSIYHHAFAFIWFSLLIGLQEVFDSTFLRSTFIGSFIIYLYLALKVHYGESILRTFFKFLVLTILYLVIFSFLAGGILIASMI